MIDDRIIYQTENGGVAVINPAPELGDQLDAIASTMVPMETAYRVVDAKTLPPSDSHDRWRWTDEGPLVVEPIPIEAAKAAALVRMCGWISDLLAPLTAGYPPEEVASWPVKGPAARSHLAAQPHPMIVVEAQMTGEDADDLARSIVARADKTSAIMAATAGLRRKTAAAIGAAQTPSAIASALDDAQKTALAMAAQMGLPPEIK